MRITFSGPSHGVDEFLTNLAAAGSRHRGYIAIWYNKISVQTAVWIANREAPISDPASAQLTIAPDGNLVLLTNRSTSPIWSTNVPGIASNSTDAIILDTGNLVLAHASNNSDVIWQSFDHSGDTWLPGSKLGRNKTTGECKRLVAWKDYGDPALGMFSVLHDPSGTSQFLLQWNNSQQYWSTGRWTGHMFSNIPEMAPTHQPFTFEYVDNNLESYFTVSMKPDATDIVRFVVDVSGQLKFFMWLESVQQWMLPFAEPKAQCDVYSLCGPFGMCMENTIAFCSCLRGFAEQNLDAWVNGDHTAGCARKVALQCHANSSKKLEDRFYEMANVRLPVDAHTVDSLRVQDCKQACLNNCSCTAYAFSGGCSLWYVDLINLQNQVPSGGGTIYIRLAASEFSSSKTNNTLITGIVSGIVFIIIIVFVIMVLFFIARNRRIKGLKVVEGSIMTFKYRDLQYVTKNFSEKLGGGAFGSVFRGLFPDGTVVAVKKLEGVRQGEKQFRAEVSTIGTIQHVNLINLLGFCSEGTRKMLVYRYMPNGSLDRHLFGSTSAVLCWDTRYQIALGIAKGLHYLHEKCRDCIIHCDVKPENVLLDASFMPKVADFGLAKLMGRDFSWVLTTMRGTIGYLAPEWITGTAITKKVDVFSYGMMLFEIISGKRNVKQDEQQDTFFPLLAARKLLAGDVQNLLDHRLAGDANWEEVERACKIALWCVQDDEDSRPTMEEIVHILEGLANVKMPPIPRYLLTLVESSSDYVNESLN